MKSPENSTSTQEEVEKDFVIKSPEIATVENVEVSNEQVQECATKAEQQIEEQSVGILSGSEQKIETSAKSMNVSSETIETVKQEQGLDNQLSEIQAEASQLASEAKLEIDAIRTEAMVVPEEAALTKNEIPNNGEAATVTQLKSLNERISRESSPDVIAKLKQESIRLTQEYVMSEVKDQRIADVVCRYIDDKNATDIQALLQGGERTKAIIEKIKKTTEKGAATSLDRALQTGERTEQVVKSLDDTSEHMEVGPVDVDLISKELAAGGSKIFIDDRKEKNINLETGEKKLDEFIETRKQSPEMALSRKEISENPEEVKRVAEGILDKVKRETEPVLRKELETITDICKSQGAEVIGMSQRTKSAESLVKKIKLNADAGRDYAIGDATDLLGGRIVVKDLHSLELVMGQVEELYGKKGVILEKENKFVKNQGKNNPYRAIHYIIQTEDGNCFELQLKTESSMIASDLYHNAVYKPEILNLLDEQKAAVEQYNWQSDYDELIEYQQKGQ